MKRMGTRWIGFILSLAFLLLACVACAPAQDVTPSETTPNASTQAPTGGDPTAVPPSNDTSADTPSEDTHSPSGADEPVVPPTDGDGEPTPEELENARARAAFVEVLRNEKTLWYMIELRGEQPSEIHWGLREMLFSQMSESVMPKQQAMVDLDGDGVEEFLLSYGGSHYDILHFENDTVYGFDVSGVTFYVDGSFDWHSYVNVFGSEYGRGRYTFVDGLRKYEELYRVENFTQAYIAGEAVAWEEYEAYDAELTYTTVSFEPFDIAFLDDEARLAIAMAEAHWGIENSGYNVNTGHRYRVHCEQKLDEYYIIALYYAYPTGYTKLAYAKVNVQTDEIVTVDYPDGKG